MTVLPGAPPLDPDRDEARRLLEEELGSGGYQVQESFVARAWRWLTDLIPDLSLAGQLPPWATWVVLGVVLLAVLAVLAFAGRDRWRTVRRAEHHPAGAVLEGARRTAAEHRSRAREALARGDESAALLEAYRSITMSAIERTLLDDRPGSTAHEVALHLAPVFPDEAPALGRAADDFDAVRYGERPAPPGRAQDVLDLDDRLAGARPELSPAPAGPTLQVPS